MVRDIEEESQFIELVAQNPGLVLVDFYAQWCGPCKRFAPRLEQLSLRFSNIQFYKVDVDEEDLLNVVKEETIAAMPTFVLYSNGVEVGRVVGVDENKLVRLLESQSQP